MNGELFASGLMMVILSLALIGLVIVGSVPFVGWPKPTQSIVDHGCGFYDPGTGYFKWNDEEAQP